MTVEEHDREICQSIDTLDGLNSERSDLLVKLWRAKPRDLTGEIRVRILEIDREILAAADSLANLIRGK